MGQEIRFPMQPVSEKSASSCPLQSERWQAKITLYMDRAIAKINDQKYCPIGFPGRPISVDEGSMSTSVVHCTNMV